MMNKEYKITRKLMVDAIKDITENTIIYVSVRRYWWNGYWIVCRIRVVAALLSIFYYVVDVNVGT